MENAWARMIKSTQEQAVASWITQLNQLRLDELIRALARQDINLEEALQELAELKVFIGDPAHILGSEATKHGEIAEHVQVNISNARRLVHGLGREYTFDGVGRTAPEDYLYKGTAVQSKFYNGAKSTLGAVKTHLEKYPDFIKNGGFYDIPKDQYREIMRVLKLAKTKPSELNRADWRLLEAVKAFQKETGLDFQRDVCPAVANYSAVQQGKVAKTVSDEEDRVRETDRENRRKAYDKSRPTVKEGLKAAGGSAALEGGVSFCIRVARKRKEEGKRLSEFTAKDWKDVGIETGIGGIKGGIRGGTIYTLTNFTATPANIACAYVTAAFGVASQIANLESGRIEEEDFIINCETVCMDVTVSAIASMAGEVLIPVPVLGAVIGNIAGGFVNELCKKRGDAKESRIVNGYMREIQELNRTLDADYYRYVSMLQKEMRRFQDLESLAFDEDINKAFTGSILLAYDTGVDPKLILISKSEIDRFFLG